MKLRKILSLLLVLCLFTSTGTSYAYAFNQTDFINVTKEEAAMAKDVFEGLSPEAQALFLTVIEDDKDLANFHKRYVDDSYNTNASYYSKSAYSMDYSRSTAMYAASRSNSNYLKMLETELKMLGLSTALYYALMANGAGIVAAGADGAFPVGDTLEGIILVLSLPVFIACADELIDNMPGIQRAFGKVFSQISSDIKATFDKLVLKVIYHTIPKKLRGKDGYVDLDSFTDKIPGRVGYKDPKTGWSIDKDNAGHGGRKWKLKDKKGKRKASLDGEGKILSK